MSENAMIQSKAKAMLTGLWTPAVVGTLIFMLINCAAGFTYVGSLIVAGPMTVGYILFMMAVVDRKETDYNTLFKGFNNFGNTLVAGLLVTLLQVAGYCLLIVPGIIVSLGLGMTFFIMAEDPTVSGVDAMQMSWNMMKGHKWELFCLYCRFIGWLILCILTLGVLTLWIEPYMLTAQLNFYRRLKYGTY